jgi:hypothetical protein
LTGLATDGEELPIELHLQGPYGFMKRVLKGLAVEPHREGIIPVPSIVDTL